ncbi:MAG TPA: hypothetical protein VFY90_02080 [Tepidiformaceae bacterium]|nr:hypothetical protein [Tepidiformaceae bacterium]
MHGARKVLAFNGVEVGDLIDADEDVLHVRTTDGHEIAISAKAVFESRGGVVRLICYDTGIHRWAV